MRRRREGVMSIMRSVRSFEAGTVTKSRRLQIIWTSGLECGDGGTGDGGTGGGNHIHKYGFL